MADVHPSKATVCGRCGQRVAARGGRAPVHCSVCGQRLTPLSPNVEHRFEPAPNVEHRFRGKPVPGWFEGFAVVFGALGLVPGCGLIFSVLALILAAAAGGRKSDSGRHVGMSAAGQLAMILGILGLVIQFSTCAVCRVVPLPRI